MAIIPPKRLALLLDNADQLYCHYMPHIKDGDYLYLHKKH